MSPELGGKRLELLKEVIPKISRVAVLANVGNVDEKDRTDMKDAEWIIRILMKSRPWLVR